MIPGYGPDCDLCAPSVHYALTCPRCKHEWDEPGCPGMFECPTCGERFDVTSGEHMAWKRDVLGLT